MRPGLPRNSLNLSTCFICEKMAPMPETLSNTTVRPRVHSNSSTCTLSLSGSRPARLILFLSVSLSGSKTQRFLQSSGAQTRPCLSRKMLRKLWTGHGRLLTRVQDSTLPVLRLTRTMRFRFVRM